MTKEQFGSRQHSMRVLAAALHPENSWDIAYPVVEQEARAFLDGRLADDGWPILLTTTELVEALWPESLARGEMILRRTRIYKALAALADHGLSDCAVKGEPRRLKHGNKLVRPWLWRKPVDDDYSKTARKTGVSRDIVQKVLAAWAEVQNAEALPTEGGDNQLRHAAEDPVEDSRNGYPADH